MNFFDCTVLLLVLASPAIGSGYNKVLQFPREVSLENYVILRPDFTDVQEELSICGWVKFYRTDSDRYWFSYATGTGDNRDNQIIFGVRVTSQYFLGDNMPGSVENFATFTWHHTCFTWSSPSQYEELYMNGQKVAEELTPADSKVPTNGTLVLGQEQDSPGGGFVLSQAFGGEIYRLQIFKRKLTAEEVGDMYKAGICDYPPPSEDVVVDWEDFLDASSHGKVEVISAGCNKWDILGHFVGQEISPELIAYLKSHH